MKRLLSLLTFILLNNIIMAQDTAPISFLALGDSYTIGESVSETERWPVQLVNIILGNVPPDAEIDAGDINGDDIINVLDIILVVNIILNS